MDLTQGGQEHECHNIEVLADAVSNGLKWIDKGFHLEKVETEVAEFRIAICNGCNDLIVEKKRCAHCCCPMEFKVTLKYNPIEIGVLLKKKLVTCPINKW